MVMFLVPILRLLETIKEKILVAKMSILRIVTTKVGLL
jgi:hypothetical protein